jgi:hypothetical protein
MFLAVTAPALAIAAAFSRLACCSFWSSIALIILTDKPIRLAASAADRVFRGLLDVEALNDGSIFCRLNTGGDDLHALLKRRDGLTAFQRIQRPFELEGEITLSQRIRRRLKRLLASIISNVTSSNLR